MNLYLWDKQALYAGALEVDPTDALPMRSTPTAPPKLSGSQVARWTGEGWEKLAASPEPEPLPAPDWAALIAARRYDAEVAGTVVGGMPIATDDRSKLLINGAALRANRSSDYVLRWKTSDGFVDLTADQVLAVADAVSEHVQACFDREDALLAAVADGTINAEMLEEGWPVLLH
jgi:hypothetical protein